MNPLRVDFDRLRPHIEGALAYARECHTMDDVWSGVESGKYQLWPGLHSVIITEVAEYPRRKLLCLFLAGGLLEELHQMLPHVLAWGRDVARCSGAFLVGRPGWTRTFLHREGWKPTAVVMELDL